MEQLKKLIEQVGNKETVAKMLSVTVRYIDLILDGTRTPGKGMMKLIRIYLVAYMDQLTYGGYMDNEYKPQEGIWTLIAPDGREQEDESPLQVCAKEMKERVPETVRAERVLKALEIINEKKH